MNRDYLTDLFYKVLSITLCEATVVTSAWGEHSCPHCLKDVRPPIGEWVLLPPDPTVPLANRVENSLLLFR